VRLGKVRVSTCHGDGFVSHQLLDGSQVNTGHCQAAGKGVPETVPSEVCETRHLNGWVKPATRPEATKHPSSGIAMLLEEQKRTERCAIQRYMPSFTILALGHSENLALEIHRIPR